MKIPPIASSVVIQQLQPLPPALGAMGRRKRNGGRTHLYPSFLFVLLGLCMNLTISPDSVSSIERNPLFSSIGMEQLQEEVSQEKNLPKKNLVRLHEVIILNHEQMQKDPMSYQPLLNLARIYLVLGEWNDASYFLHKALILQKENHSALFLSAIVDSTLGRQKEAINHLERLYKLVPHQGKVARLLAKLYGINQSFEQGIDLLQAYLRDHPEDTQAVVDLGAYNVIAGHVQEGITFLEEARRRGMGMDAELIQYLSIAYFKAKEYERSVLYQKQIVKQFPLRMDTRRLLSVLHIFNQDLYQAESEINLLMRIGDRSSETYFVRGCIASLHNEWDDVLRFTTSALDQNAQFHPAKLLKYKALKETNQNREAAHLFKEMRRDPMWKQFSQIIQSEQPIKVNDLLSSTITVSIREE